jgi:hypothetical protein
MTMLHVAAAALLLLQPAAPVKNVKKPAAPPQKTTAAVAKTAAPKTAPTDLAVTVTYKGKGTVDANHKLIAWLFTDSAISSSSRPIATLSTEKNGDTLTFKDVASTPVYIFTAYDQKGGYDGISGPPPAGIPTSLYRKAAKGAPTPVQAGGPAVKLTFDDSQPWNK